MKYHDKYKNYKKQHFQQNRKKVNESRRQYEKNRIITDVHFRLIQNTRRTTHHALKSTSKSSSTRDFVGLDIDTYRKWIEYQMTPDKTWDNIEIDHVKTVCFVDVSKDEELKEAFN